MWQRVRSGTACPSSKGHGHEIVVKVCRALSCRFLVNHPAVRPGCVANRNKLQRSAPSGHDRSPEADGKATSGEAGGKRCGISPDIVNRSHVNCSNINCSNAIGCARFTIGEDCQAGESRQQLQRRLRIEPPARQCPLGWMQRVDGRANNCNFFRNVQGQPHLHILRELRRDQGVLGRLSQQSLLVLQQPVRRREVSSRRAQAIKTSALVLERFRAKRIPFRVKQTR